MEDSNNRPPVFYLCRASATGGLVFPDELSDDYYAPGVWFVEEAEDGRLSATYSFLAAHDDQYVELSLVRTDAPDAFQVDAGQFGIFAFSASALDNTLRYTGNRRHAFNGMRLWELGLADQQEMERLERVCLQHDFYFLGYTD